MDIRTGLLPDYIYDADSYGWVSLRQEEWGMIERGSARDMADIMKSLWLLIRINEPGRIRYPGQNTVVRRMIDEESARNGGY